MRNGVNEEAYLDGFDEHCNNSESDDGDGDKGHGGQWP